MWRLFVEDNVKNVMAAVFEVSPDQISGQTSPHDLESWDSLKHMNLVAALEEEFDIKFEDEEIQSLVNFDIIVATVKAYVE